MSVIFRLLFVLAGSIAALFVARDAMHFDLVQTIVSIALVAGLIVAGMVWRSRRSP